MSLNSQGLHMPAGARCQEAACTGRWYRWVLVNGGRGYDVEWYASWRWSLTIRLIALVSQKTRKQARTRWMRIHPSRCEEPLREAGVCGRELREWKSPRSGDDHGRGMASTGPAASGELKALESSDSPFDATSFFPQPFGVRARPRSGPRGLDLG